MFNVVDYRSHKENREKVIPYDSLVPFCKIDMKEEHGEMEYELIYEKLEERASLEKLKNVNIINSSYDYKLLWRCYLFSIGDYSNPISNDESMLLDERRKLNWFKINNFLKMQIYSVREIVFQSKVSAAQQELSLLENLILAIVKDNKKDIKLGFSDLNEDSEIKRVKVTNRNFSVFLKYVFEYKVDLTIHDMITNYTENNIENFFSKTENILFNQQFNNDPMYKSEKDISFKKRSEKNVTTIEFVYRVLSKTYSIYGFEMFRAISLLLKRGLILYKEGVLSIAEGITFIDSKIIELTKDFIEDGKMDDAVKIFLFMTEEREVVCNKCKVGTIYFNGGALCSKCRYFLQDNYYGEKFTSGQITLLLQTGQLFFFSKGRPLVLYLREKEDGSTAISPIPKNNKF